MDRGSVNRNLDLPSVRIDFHDHGHDVALVRVVSVGAGHEPAGSRGGGSHDEHLGWGEGARQASLSIYLDGSSSLDCQLLQTDAEAGTVSEQPTMFEPHAGLVQFARIVRVIEAPDLFFQDSGRAPGATRLLAQEHGRRQWLLAKVNSNRVAQLLDTEFGQWVEQKGSDPSSTLGREQDLERDLDHVDCSQAHARPPFFGAVLRFRVVEVQTLVLADGDPDHLEVAHQLVAEAGIRVGQLRTGRSGHAQNDDLIVVRIYLEQAPGVVAHEGVVVEAQGPGPGNTGVLHGPDGRPDTTILTAFEHLPELVLEAGHAGQRPQVIEAEQGIDPEIVFGQVGHAETAAQNPGPIAADAIIRSHEHLGMKSSQDSVSQLTQGLFFIPSRSQALRFEADPPENNLLSRHMRPPTGTVLTSWPDSSNFILGCQDKQNKNSPVETRKFLVRRVGIEPTTLGLKGLCSTTELPALVFYL